MLERLSVDVAVVGGGASGALTALQLLRRAAPPWRVALIDAHGSTGRGAAYGTDHPLHLLNVPAGKMSALPEAPNDFVAWLAKRGERFEPGDYVRRSLFGQYLVERLEEAVRRAPSGVECVRIRERVQAVERSDAGWRVGSVDTRAVVLATGNEPPGDLPVPDGGLYASARYVREPWRPFRPLEPTAPVLVLGSGLTMADAVLTLRDAGHRGPLHVLSRHGLLPLAHQDIASSPVAPEPAFFGASLREKLRACRVRASQAGLDWRSVIDGLRPDSDRFWQGMGLTEQRRFLRHLRAHWDVHRHRLAPEVGRRLDTLSASGDLRIHAGRVVRFSLEREKVVASYRLRGESALRTLEVAQVVNCTGPKAGLGHVPLYRSLFEAGEAVPDPLGFGVVTDAVGRVVRPAAEPRGALFALGPLRRGDLWETTAIPEIRMQAEALASLLTPNPVQ